MATDPAITSTPTPTNTAFTSELQSGKYELTTASGTLIMTAASIEDAEEYAEGLPDGEFILKKIVKRLFVATPEPRRKITTVSLESRPRKPRDPNAPKRKRTAKPTA